jgi:chorismate mutase
VSPHDDSEPLARLAKCREEIAELDAQIIAAFAKRVTLAMRTAALKQAAGLPILDPKREAEVIRRNVALARDAGLPEEAVRAIFWHLLGISRRAQETG